MSLRKKLFNRLKFNSFTNYGIYEGSLNIWNIILWNIIFPERLLNRLKGKTIFKKKFDNRLYSYSKFNFKQIYNEFRENGCIVIQNYFDEKKINKILEIYKDDIKFLKNNVENKHSFKLLHLNLDLCEIWLDDNLIALMKNMSSSELYARNYPQLTYSCNFKNQMSSKEKFEKNLKPKFADDWHIDHSNLFNLHIILEDIDESGTCMEYIPGSHKLLNQPMLYSDEEISKYNKGIKKCFGKKGTVYLHYGNTLHRMFTVQNKTRLQLHFEYSSKTNILLNCKNIYQTMHRSFDIDQLDPTKRKVCSGVYPLSLHKGYDVNKGKFYKSGRAI